MYSIIQSTIKYVKIIIIVTLLRVIDIKEARGFRFLSITVFGNIINKVLVRKLLIILVYYYLKNPVAKFAIMNIITN